MHSLLCVRSLSQTVQRKGHTDSEKNAVGKLRRKDSQKKSTQLEVLNLGLPSSRTVRKFTSVVETMQPVVLCYAA